MKIEGYLKKIFGMAGKGKITLKKARKKVRKMGQEDGMGFR